MPSRLEDLAFRIGGVRKFLIIKLEVLSHFMKFRQIGPWQREAGGQLFGTFESEVITIRHATGPYSRDRRSRRRFTPCPILEKRDIDQFYDRGQHFIGNWHTHPECRPSPSATDLSNTCQRFAESEHQLLSFTMIIVGRAEFPSGLYVGLINSVGHQQLTEVVLVSAVTGEVCTKKS